MGDLPTTVQRLTGLILPGAVSAVGADGPARRSRGERGVRLSGERLRGRVVGGAPVEEAVRCTYDEARITSPTLVGLCALSSFRLAALETPAASEGARLTGSDLEGVAVTGGDLTALEVHGCSLREADLRDITVATVSLCDLYGARLQRVRVETLCASDLTGATLVDCDWSDADLRGSVFRRATFKGGSLAGARVDGADFRGATLPAGVAKSLRSRGARVGNAAPILGVSALAIGVVIVAAVWSLRPTPVVTRPAPAVDREVTQTERTRTQAALSQVREGLIRANARMTAEGAPLRVWPTILELQNNRYDVDGDGPGDTTEPLFQQGLPDNYLTDVQGSVLPYCNDVPDQPTLSEVNADWHYCEVTGRIFASAGWSGEATLNW